MSVLVSLTIVVPRAQTGLAVLAYLHCNCPSVHCRYSQVNETANRVRAAARRIVSANAEAKMSRAASGKLGTRKRTLAQTLASAEARLAEGRPPTDDAEQEWARLEELDRLHGAQAAQEVSRH